MLIHAHFGQEGYRCLRARRLCGLPMVTTFYGMDASSLLRIPAWATRFRRLFAEGRLFLAEGPHLAQRLVDAGCPVDKLRVHKLGADLKAIPYNPGRRQTCNRRIVLMCGYFNEKKGFPIGVAAFARIAGNHPDVRLHIVGDGPQRVAIQSVVRDCGLDERVTFFGLVDGSAYLRRLLECEVLLHPSMTAADGDTEGGSPVVITEAMAAGKPIVSSLHADIPVAAPAGECALLAPEGDVEGLAEALHALLSDEAMRRQMGASGRRHVTQHHDAAKQAEKLEAIYDEVSL